MNELTHERYANFYTDFAFKKLFGTEASPFAIPIAIGVEKRNIEIVRNLKNMNMPIDVIVQITGLTVWEIEQI